MVGLLSPEARMSRQGTPAEQPQGTDRSLEEFYKDRLRSFVHALESKKQGDSSEYYRVLQELDNVFKDVGQLRLFVQCVTYFDERAHEFLLMQLLGTSLWTCPNEVSDVILEFAVNLVAAQPAALHLCLEMLVRNFLPPSCGLPAFIGVSRRGEPVGLAAVMKARERRQEDLARKDDVLKRVFATLERISRLVPTAPTRLQSIIIQKMPHRRSDKEFHNLYIKGVLTIAEEEAWSSLRDHLLAAVIDRLIEIDVEIRWEDIVKQEEEMRDNNKVYLFHMDLDDESDEDIEPVEQEKIEAPAPGSEAAHQHGLLGPRGRPVPTLDEMADKMDEMMCMTIEHIRLRADRGEIQQVYKAVERSFLTTILDTHKSKFTQFLLFFLCSLAPATCGVSFANLLCGIAVSPNRSIDTRMSAAAYLASFLARSKFIPLSTIMDCLSRLTSWCGEYANIEEERRKVRTIGGPSTQEMIRASVFYAVCQAILYVICYRLHQLLKDSELEHAMRALPLQWIFTDHLNPLAACLESVVQEFERQATASRLLDGKRLQGLLATKHLHPGMSFGGVHQLDMFFPFDPYLLRQSNRFIRPIYIKWQQPRYACSDSESERGTEGEEDDANEDSVDRAALLESSDDEDETPERMAMSVSDKSHVWPSSAEDRGISPAPRSIGMGSYGSDGFSDQARSCEPMSLTSPSHLIPLPSKLPSKMPRKFSFGK